MKCRHCKNPLTNQFLDLGFAPPSNAYLETNDITSPEVYFPLKVMACEKCWLVQTKDYTEADKLFTDNYAYFSSTSKSFLKHAEDYSKKIIQSLHLTRESFVIEIASNDGYLLQNFVKYGIPCMGIEPTKSTADESKKKGINVLEEFFGQNLAKKMVGKNKQADLIIGNNVYAHVPEINDFTAGLKTCLKDRGTITLEFPHILNLLEYSQFDTVYHEHFSYLSLTSVNNIFKSHGLKIYDVEKLTTHGGSLRIYGCHENHRRDINISVNEILEEENHNNLNSIDTYLNFQSKADKAKNLLLKFLLEMKDQGKIVAAYGAAAKGNTLLNYAGIKPDLIKFVADAAPSKQNKFMPGSHIPIVSPDYLFEEPFDYLLILPWNIANEICAELSNKINPKVKFVIAIPELTII